jgi:peptidoglycan/xylan/chitin deacetylase (PgdA/CDA1 family)
MRFDWLLPSIAGIPVLMYHRVWPGLNDGLTITPEKLREQWLYLKEQGYNTVSLPDFLDIIKGKKAFSPKTILLTFDDGYHNNLTYVYPLLKELNWQAAIFIIADTLDGTAKAQDGMDQRLSITDMLSFDPAIIQLGLHGYSHEDFNQAGVEGIKDIMRRSVAAFEQSKLPYHKVLAYPYGARPKNSAVLKTMKQWFAEFGLEAAFRIGNQVSKVPAPDIYEIRRIDIKGTDSLADFKIKLKKGKLKPF